MDAWLWLLAEHGSWELPDVLSYAIDYAEHGHPVHQNVVTTIERVREHFVQHWPTSAALWLDAEGRAPAAGALIVNPVYAGVLRRLVAAAEQAGERGAARTDRISAARREWKTGFVAQAVEQFVRQPHRHSDDRDHAGVMRASDLAAFDAGDEDAVTYDFRGWRVHKTGPWGQGPVLLQMLAILDAYGRLHGLDDEHLDPSTAFGIHVIAEAEKLALADRDAWYGDPAFVDVPLPTLLSAQYAESRAALIGESAGAELRPGSPGGRLPHLPPLATGAGKGGLEESDAVVSETDDHTTGIGEPTVDRHGQTRGDTCHLDVLDRWGNIVTVTPSGGWLQSSPTIPGLGFCLGTRLQMAWLDESVPTVLRPGARPRTTLSATLITSRAPGEDQRVSTLGTPGGDQQDQWQLPALLRMLVGGWSAQAAIDAPMFHTTSHISSFWPRDWEPAGLVVEERLGESVIDELRRRGHRVTVSGSWTLGRLSAVGMELATADSVPSGVLWAAANPRGMQGYAAGR
ncbi:gamma-glutamyltransferase [Humibacter antri]